MRIGRRVLLGLLVVVVIGGTTGVVAVIRRHVVFGTVFDESAPGPAVHPGERFSLAVPDLGRSVGDEWSATVTPAGVLSADGSRQVPDNPVDRAFGAQRGGGAGVRYFRFTAKQRGTVTVRLSNCFQGLCRIRPSDPRSRQVTWTVTVE